jgi:glutaryl-CoA dehydrogenase (non-decarboxylating)
MFMDFQLSKLEMLRKAVREFANKKLAPNVDEWDANHYFPYKEAMLPMGELGFFGTVIPEKYDGDDMGWVAAMIVTEEIARVSSSLRVQINMQVLGCAFTIFTYGSEALCETYIPKLCQRRIRRRFRHHRARCRLGRHGHGLHRRRQGRPLADQRFQDLDLQRGRGRRAVIYYAYTDKDAGSKGLSAFVIELKNFNGVKTTALDKMGSFSSPTGEIFLDNTRVPKENILGKPGDGAKILFGSLNQTRLSAAAGAVGVAQACLDVTTTRTATTRKQFGKPIGQFQMNQDMIAQMATEDRGRAPAGVQSGLGKGPGQAEQRPGRGHGQVLRRRDRHPLRQLRHAHPRRLRLLHGVPDGAPLPGCAHLHMVEGSANICKWIIALDQLGYRKANR